MSATNPYHDLPNIYYGEDGNTYCLKIENMPSVKMRWDENGDNRLSYDAPSVLDDNIKQQISILEERGRTRRPRFRPI